jgi:hypothetical protein
LVSTYRQWFVLCLARGPQTVTLLDSGKWHTQPAHFRRFPDSLNAHTDPKLSTLNLNFPEYLVAAETPKPAQGGGAAEDQKWYCKSDFFSFVSCSRAGRQVALLSASVSSLSHSKHLPRGSGQGWWQTLQGLRNCFPVSAGGMLGGKSGPRRPRLLCHWDTGHQMRSEATGGSQSLTTEAVA